MFKYLPIAILLSLVCLSCSSDDKWQYSQDMSIQGAWNREDAMSFTLLPTDEDNQDIYVSVAHTSTFEYENLYLKCVVSQGGSVLHEEMLSLQMMDGEGHWLGIPKQDSYSLNQKMASIDMRKGVNVKISQHSREEKLQGITGIGVRVKRNS